MQVNASSVNAMQVTFTLTVPCSPLPAAHDNSFPSSTALFPPSPACLHPSPIWVITWVEETKSKPATQSRDGKVGRNQRSVRLGPGLNEQVEDTKATRRK